MKIIGIIAEYNPFHLGHLYQIDKIKEIYPDSLIIAIISTYFTERGDISIINKWDKTKICLDNNIDIVIELPTLYSTQSADIFAKYAIKILNEFHIEYLSFGSETDNIELFTKLASIQINNKEYDTLVKNYMDKGNNYPTAMNKALYKLTGYNVIKPNDILSLSYIKTILENNYNIIPLSIKRLDNYHSKDTNNNIISANLIRELLLNNKDISPYIPKGEINYLYKNISLESLFPLLKYKVNLSEDLSSYLSVSEGIDNRIKKYINTVNSWNELVNSIKTKRYTYNKINRILLHIVLDIKDNINNTTPYIRILGFNTKGKDYLNKIKKDINLDIFYKYKSNKNIVFDIENKCTLIYSIIVNDNNLYLKEFMNKPIIK